jgi:Methylase involved in ubiquinone/menaquinone biosynthesis
MHVNYDELAPDYINYRVPDARIAAMIHRHLAPGSKVLNVGAGQGSYEPTDRDLIALEPSQEMISRRANSCAPAIQGCAEALPFADNSFDASLAILTIHHWRNIRKGLAEMRRVTRGKIIILTWNGDFGDFWLPDYLPEIAVIDTKLFPSIDQLAELLGGFIEVEKVAIPHDCTDGFMCAYWRRPEAYLNPAARNAISTFARLGPAIDDGVNRLCQDLDSGLWQQRYQSLLQKSDLDCGYRLVVHDKMSFA